MVLGARSQSPVGMGQDRSLASARVHVVQASAQGDDEVLALGTGHHVVHLGSGAGPQHHVGPHNIADCPAVLQRFHAQLSVAVVIVAGLAEHGPAPPIIGKGHLARPLAAQKLHLDVVDQPCSPARARKAASSMAMTVSISCRVSSIDVS